MPLAPRFSVAHRRASVTGWPSATGPLGQVGWPGWRWNALHPIRTSRTRHLSTTMDAMASLDARQRVAVELRHIRKGLGLSGEAVAAALGHKWSQSKVSRIETGRISVSIPDLINLLNYYDVPQKVKVELLTLTAEEAGVDGAWIVRAIIGENKE
jgi:hypothetical protein